ncbi:MAG: hypothetical protein ACRC1K_18770, partial [Planctomycetia bacterium]
SMEGEAAAALAAGVDWLASAVRDGRYLQPAPIGFYFAKRWYFEQLYPLIFTVGALRSVVETLDSTGRDGTPLRSSAV